MSRAIDSADFKRHFNFAVDSNIVNHVRHPLFHETVRIYLGLMPSGSREHILLATALTFMAPVPLPIFWWLRRISRRQLPDYMLMLLALGLVIMSPITLWTENKYLLGYFNPVVYHNPTLNALRPFLVPLTLLSLLVFERMSARDLSRQALIVGASAAIMVLSTLAKPSYAIALLPGLCLVAGYRYLRKRSVDSALLVFGFCLPGVIVLGGLYLAAFTGVNEGRGIALGFLTVLAEYVPVWRIPIQLILSIAFPALVYLLFLSEARQHIFLNLSWVVFAVAAAIALFVIDRGWIWRTGDFLWTGYAAVFVLMFASASFIIEQYSLERESATDVRNLPGSRLSFRFNLVMLVFGLHVLSGVAYYFRTISEF